MAGPVPRYTLGVEIEVIAEPHKVRQPLREKHALYYELLAKALRKRGLRAQHNDLTQREWRSSNYNEWYITRDGSLGQPDDLIPMEAVSPILDTGADWAGEIDTFWEAMRAVFHMPQRAGVCGSHVHVSRGRNQRFTLAELKTIAYGIVVYEDLVLELLMAYRQDHAYCKPNSKNSARLQQAAGSRVAVANMIRGAATPEALRDIMQNSRYVLWNFDNVAMNKSGTIEFRGGRFLRGEVRTKRWMAFAVAFIHAMLRMNDLATNGLSARSAAGLYSQIKAAAQQLGMGEFLPSKYGVLNETLPST